MIVEYAKGNTTVFKKTINRLGTRRGRGRGGKVGTIARN